MKVKFSELSCLSGYYGISVSTQFQRNRTIRFRNILHTLYPFFIYMLLSALSTSSPDVSVMVTSISLSVQRNTIHAAFIKSPYTHQNRSSFRNKYLFTKTLIYCFMEFLFWLYLLIVLSGDIEINPGPESVDLSSSCSNTHYLLTCPRYTHMRDEMVTSISQITNLTITTDVLLFGNDEVSDEVNTTIFEAVQKFIKTSKRFAN